VRVHVGSLRLHGEMSNRMDEVIATELELLGEIRDLLRTMSEGGSGLKSPPSAEERTQPRLTGGDIALLGLLASGESISSMATRLGVRRKALYQRRFRLAKRLELSGTGNLLRCALEMGFGKNGEMQELSNRMIEGLKVKVKGLELMDICRKRALELRAKAEAVERQVDAIAEVGIEATGSSDPKRALADRRRNLEADASELDFTAAHLDAAEDYLLDRSDLARIGIWRSAY
jgi:hypothetical protein